MLSGVSWTNYFLFVSVGTILWWLGILLIFYHKKAMKIVSGFNFGSLAQSKYVDEIPPDDKPQPENSDPLQVVQAAISEIKKVFASANKDTPKSEINSLIKRILIKYPQLKYSEFKIGIIDLIQSNASRVGISPFSPEDLETIWKFNN